MSATATPAIKIEATAKLDGVVTAHDYKYKTIMTSITQFSSTINKIRDILRLHTPSIVNEQSTNHICLYILARYLTIKKCSELKIPLDFAWENIVKQYRSVDGGVQRAYDLFYSPTDECFIRYLDEIFGTSTEDYPFKVKELEKHKQIIELMDKIDMDSIDIGIDPIGFVYEDELSHSKGARKNGEHFTDRRICEYMTKLVNPRLNSDGIPESVCDPSMGTGGFLFTYLKFFKDAKIGVNWNIHKHRIYGQDVINSSVCKAKMNLYVNTNVVFENLILRNSLTNDLLNTSFDIILANMPFGLKGIKHADCCERVKALKIRGTKSEPLFLQLMMVSLNMGGRCAVVVPDGILVNSSSCHNDTRKYLLDNFDLKRVIKMKGQFFMNTSIQPSILFFEKTGTPTEAVEFWEVVKGDKGEITETMVVSVSSATIKGDTSCSLDMRRYQEVSVVVNTGGYPMVKLGDVATLKQGFPFKSADYVSVGKGLYVLKHNNLQDGVVELSKNQDCIAPSENTTNYLLTKGDVVVSMDFDCGKVGKIVSDGWVLNQRMSLLRANPEYLSQDYLYWILFAGKFHEDMTNVNTGTTIKHISGKNISEAMIPLPPLDIQQEIVTALDLIYNNATTAKAAAESVKSQMAAVVRSVSARGYQRMKISELTHLNPETASKCEKDFEIEYIDLGSVKEGEIQEPQRMTFATKPSRAQRKVKDGDTLWGSVRPLSKSYAFMEAATENTLVSTGFIVSRVKNTSTIIPKFFYYLSTSDEAVAYLNERATGSSYPAFSTETLGKYAIPVPPLPIQQEVLAILNEMEAERKALEQMAAKAEQRAKFILDGYLTPVEVANPNPIEMPKKKRSIKIADEEELVFDT